MATQLGSWWPAAPGVVTSSYLLLKLSPAYLLSCFHCVLPHTPGVAREVASCEEFALFTCEGKLCGSFVYIFVSKKQQLCPAF